MKKPAKSKSSVVRLTHTAKPVRVALEDRGDFSKTAENALILLNAISRLGPVTLGELVTELKLNRTVVHRLLTTLQRQSFIIKFEGSFLVGPALLRLASAVLPALRTLIAPTMRQLAALTRETVSCAIRDGNSWVILEQVLDTSHVVHVREEIGRRFPLHLGAHGHALMAMFDAPALDGYYARVTVPDKLKAEIENARDLGYAISRSELRDGVVGVAAAGMFAPENLPFSLAVILPSVREADLPGHLMPLLDSVTAIAAIPKAK